MQAPLQAMNEVNTGRFVAAPSLDAKALADALTKDPASPEEAAVARSGHSDQPDSSAAKAALRKILPLLWQRGAKSVTYRQMCSVAALTRADVLRLWPNKQALLRSAIGLYRETELAPMLSVLERGGKAGLVDFWSREEARLGRAGTAGCFLFRTANSQYGRDAVIADMFEDYIGQVHNRIVRAVIEGQRVGELAKGLDPVASGWQCVSILSLASAQGNGSRRCERQAALFAAARRSCGL